MNRALVGFGFFGILAALSAFVGRPRGVSPRVAAGAHLVSLLGWAVLPVVWLACLGTEAGSWLGGMRSTRGTCLLGVDGGEWHLLGWVPSALLLVVLVWHGVRRLASARHVELRGWALAGSIRRPTSAGEVWVIPVDRPVAFAAGLLRCRAVVSQGLLAPLAEHERGAVCEHEAAHVRLGHPRLLLLGSVVAAAYGWFPPVSRAWEGLRRELEAAADDEAVRMVGRQAVLSALVRVALLPRDRDPWRPTGGFGGPEHLRWRMARLEHPVSAPRWTTLVGAAAVATGLSMAVVACELVGRPFAAFGLSICLGPVALVGLRPTWLWGRRSAQGDPAR
jgi:hypothetical protein